MIRLLAFLLLLPVWAVAGAPRENIPLPTWDFAAERELGVRPAEQAGWKSVQIPHVFRQAGLPDDAAGWYRQTIALTPEDKGRVIFLRLDGAASVKEVFVNGKSVGQHRGAFSAAVFDLTPELKAGAPNEVAVRVSNRAEETVGCFSRSKLYYVNGGMFRPAWLIKTGAVQVFPELGSSGVYLTPAKITASSAELGVRTIVRNTLATPAEVTVRHVVNDPEGVFCAILDHTQTVAPGVTATLQAVGQIKNPQLWDLGKPNLYTVRTELVVNGKVTDEVTAQTGFRTIAMKDGRFFLNGHEVQFRGVNKHEQTEGNWNAADEENSRHEFQQMVELGANTVRLPHYPHSQLEYQLADELGLAVWAENGFAGQVWQKNAPAEENRPTPDGERLTREMVRQLWNHPGILFWSAGNETIVETVERYADMIREEDHTRLITYAANNKEPRNCDFVARNTYAGWYGGQLYGFADPRSNTIVSETGAGNFPTQHVPFSAPLQWKVNSFEPEEYAGLFTEFRLQTVCRNDVAQRPMFLWWVLRDFYDHKFKDRINTKGLISFGGAPKDLYFLFQAFLRPENPVLHLCGRHHFLRGFALDDGIKAYANAAEVELFINGASQGKKRNGEYLQPETPEKNADGSPKYPRAAIHNVFFWNAPLQPGRNVVEIRDERGGSEQMIVYQKAADGTVPADPRGLVRNLTSSNPQNPAVWIDGPAEAEGPVYSDVNGASDNTFAALPAELTGASWIATRRLSDPALQTNMSFQIAPDSGGATVFVLFSTGTFPRTTLQPPDANMMQAASSFQVSLTAAGFHDTGRHPLWRDTDLNLAHAALWSRRVQPGEELRLPGQTLDYVFFIQK